MKQEDFQNTHRSQWARLAVWLDRQADKNARSILAAGAQPLTAREFPAAYRRLCQQLALAERRGYSDRLLDELRTLVQRGHVLLYRPPRPRLRLALEFIAADFPRLVRAQGRALAISALLLLVPAVGFTVLLHYRPELVYTLCSQDQLDRFARMYSPQRQSVSVTDGQHLAMFAFYIYNNVGIGLRTLASGLLACVGAIFVLLSNGVLFGAIAGHLTNIGEGPQFWRFVVGHSGLELTAIVISGAGGLRLGMAILAPGRRTRARAFVETGREMALLALGIFAMLVAAAFVEAYWSSQADIPAGVKYTVGALVWAGVLGWLWRGGRGAPASGGG